MKNKSLHRSCSRKNISQPVNFELTVLSFGQTANILKKGDEVDICPAGIGLTTDYHLHKGDVVKLLYPIDLENTRLPVFS